MNKLLRSDAEAVKAIVGWCAFADGNRVTGVHAKGSSAGDTNDGWDEEMWCHDRVETAIISYKEAYQPLGYANIAAMRLRRLLKEVFWNSKEMQGYGEFEHLVFAEIVRFKNLVSKECKACPRPKFFEVA